MILGSISHQRGFNLSLRNIWGMELCITVKSILNLIWFIFINKNYRDTSALLDYYP